MPEQIAPHQWYRIEQAVSGVVDVYLYDEVSWFGIMAADFVTELNAVKADTLRLHLNSPGGLVDDGIAIFNALKNHPAQVEVFVEGVAASIASVIAMAGDRVVIAPHARMMIHNARMMADGDDEDFLAASIRLADCNRNIASIYAERAGGDADAWLPLMKATTWYSDQAAVDAGLADEVGRSNDQQAAALAARQIAHFDLSRYPEGDRMVARLVTELAHGDVLPEDEPEPEPNPEALADGEEPPAERHASDTSEEANDWLLDAARRREALLADIRR